MHSGDLSFTLLSCSDGLSTWVVGNDIAVHMSITKATDMDKAFDQSLTELRERWDVHNAYPQYDILKRIEFLDESLQSFWRDWITSQLTITRIDKISLDNPEYRLILHNLWKGELVVGDDLKMKEKLHRIEEPQ